MTYYTFNPICHHPLEDMGATTGGFRSPPCKRPRRSHFLGVGHKIEIDYYMKLDYHTKFQVIWFTCSAAALHAVPVLEQ